MTKTNDILKNLENTQNLAISILKEAIKNNKINHAYLFYGLNDQDKYNLAFFLSKILLCVDNNICENCVNCKILNKNWNSNYELNSLSNIHPDLKVYIADNKPLKIEQVREIVNKSIEPPFQCKYQVYIIYGIDNITIEAGNAFLKTLEEPLEHTKYILFANTLENVLPTIVSRTQVIPLNNIVMETDLPLYLIPQGDNLPLHKIFTIIQNWLEISKSDKKDELKLFLRKLQEHYWNKIKDSLFNDLNKQILKLYYIEEAINYINNNVDPKVAIENCFIKILYKN